MRIRRPLLWIAGALLLGELMMIPEVGDCLRWFAFLGFAAELLLLPWEAAKRRGPLWRTGPFALLLLGCFLVGAGRASLEAARFHTPEAETFFEAYAPRNDGAFDYGLYLKSQGVYSEESLKRFQEGGLLSSELPYFAQLGAFRKLCESVLGECFNEKDAGIYRALILGDRSTLPEDVQSLYQSQGIAHLLAVSGLHLSIIGMGCFRILMRLGRSIGEAGALSSLLVVSYGILTGSGGSALRAVLMLLVRFWSMRIGRGYDTLSALALSFVLLLLYRPYLVLSSGFQLSYAAILGLSLLGEELIRAAGRLRAERRDSSASGGKPRRAERLPAFARTLLSSASVQLVTMPLILYHFYVFPPYGILLNLVVIPLMGFVMSSGLAALLIGLLGACALHVGPTGNSIFSLIRALASAAGGAGHYLLCFYEFLCGMSAKLPASAIVVGKPSILAIIVYYALMLALFRTFFRGKRRAPAVKPSGPAGPGLRRVLHMGKRTRWHGLVPGMVCCSYLLLVLACGAALFTKRAPRELCVTAIDVGQGDGFLLRYHGISLLLDAGSSSENSLGKYTLRPFLLSQGIGRLDAVLLSHSDADHVNGFQYLCEEVPEIRIDALLLPGAAAKGLESSPVTEETSGDLKALPSGEKSEGSWNFGERSVSYRLLAESFLRANPRGVIRCLAYGDRISLGDDEARQDAGIGAPQLVCLYEGAADAPEANRHSPVLLLRCGDFSMLFTGDMTGEDEILLRRRLQDRGLWATLSQNKPLTVLKLAHHGSRSSNTDAILKLFAPRFALVSYGRRNSYGHPSREVRERLARYGVPLLRTGESGQIRLRTDGTRLWIDKRLDDSLQ